MTRKNFIKIIKLRSFWKIDKRRGNYKLPSGAYLSDYVAELVEQQLAIDKLGIRKDGSLVFCTGGNWNEANKDFDDYKLIIPFGDTEACSFDNMEKRINKLVSEIVG